MSPSEGSALTRAWLDVWALQLGGILSARRGKSPGSVKASQGGRPREGVRRAGGAASSLPT